MGYYVRTYELEAGLRALNKRLAEMMELAVPYEESIASYAGEEGLQGEAYTASKDYMQRGHLAAVRAQKTVIREFMRANEQHIALLYEYLPGESEVNEDVLIDQLNQIQYLRGMAERLQLYAYEGLLAELEQNRRNKLERLYAFVSASGSVYSGIDVSAMQQAVNLLHSAVYDSTLGVKVLPLSTKGSGTTEEMFKKNMKEQFGFDDRTVDILWDIYEAVQKLYADLPQKERDWYFARAISQLGDYNDKPVKILFFSVETHAWRKGAGWAYKYDEEEEFFCKKLGLSEGDYKYIRQMVRLQHFMTSDPEQYSYNGLEMLSRKNKEHFNEWKKTMEQAMGRSYSDSEYKDFYKQLYIQMGSKGDFSHMMYTVSANLIDKGHKVDNVWNNWGAQGMSWAIKGERKDIVGWLGDAVYKGDEYKTSFGEDDYIADLDADNIAKRVTKKTRLADAVNEYYSDISKDPQGENAGRTKEFLKNNPYEEVEAAVFERIEFNDPNGNGIKDLDDLKNNKVYEETYDFLARLKKIDEGESN